MNSIRTAIIILNGFQDSNVFPFASFIAIAFSTIQRFSVDFAELCVMIAAANLVYFLFAYSNSFE